MTLHATEPVRLDSIDDLAWIRGAWIEECVDRTCEEIWSGPSGNTMMGMFRWIRDDEVSFFEFMAILVDEGVVELHAKHFHPTLVAWEDRQRFQGFVLSELSDEKAVFAAKPAEEGEEIEGGWLIYEQVDDDRLVVHLLKASGEEKLAFHFVRAA
jgi:hypothetical protein